MPRLIDDEKRLRELEGAIAEYFRLSQVKTDGSGCFPCLASYGELRELLACVQALREVRREATSDISARTPLAGEPVFEPKTNDEVEAWDAAYDRACLDTAKSILTIINRHLGGEKES